MFHKVIFFASLSKIFLSYLKSNLLIQLPQLELIQTIQDMKNSYPFFLSLEIIFRQQMYAVVIKTIKIKENKFSIVPWTMSNCYSPFSKIKQIQLKKTRLLFWTGVSYNLIFDNYFLTGGAITDSFFQKLTFSYSNALNLKEACFIYSTEKITHFFLSMNQRNVSHLNSIPDQRNHYN